MIAQALAHPDQRGTFLGPEVVEQFESFLARWDELASTGTRFLWVDDIDRETVEQLGRTFLGLVEGLDDDARRRGYPISPPEGEEFYQCLVAGFLEALAADGAEGARAADELRESWPGFKAD